MEQSPLFTKTTAKPMQDSKVFFLQFFFWTHNYFLIISVIPPCFHLNSDNAEINAAPETWPRCSFCRTRCNKLLEYTFLRCHWREPKQASKKSQYHHLPALSFSIRSAKNINHWKSLVQQIQEKAHHKMLSPQKTTSFEFSMNGATNTYSGNALLTNHSPKERRSVN